MSCLSHHHHHHQLHVHSFTITPHVPFQISHHNKHVPGGQPLSYLFHTTARPHHCLSVRLEPVAAIVSIFPFPLHKQKRLRSTSTSLLNLLPFYMFFLSICGIYNTSVSYDRIVDQNFVVKDSKTLSTLTLSHSRTLTSSQGVFSFCHSQ